MIPIEFSIPSFLFQITVFAVLSALELFLALYLRTVLSLAGVGFLVCFLSMRYFFLGLLEFSRFNTTLVTGLTSTSSGLSGIIGELQSILSYLLGSTTGGNGLVETIASMNDKLAHANATADQNWAMNDTTDRRRRAETIVAQRRIARADDVGGYEETTAAGGRGVGSAATLASKLSIDADIVAKMTENQNGFTEKAEVLNRANYCSAQDVTNKRPGCSAVGQLPSADIELGTLTTLPTKDASTPTNVTLAKLYALHAPEVECLWPKAKLASRTSSA